MDQFAHESLVDFARAIVCAAEPVEKVALAEEAARRWRKRALSKGKLSQSRQMPERPGRPERPVLLTPRMMPRRGTSGKRGRIALMHAIAHIELNAIDLTWDLIGRFAHVEMPPGFLDDWVRVGVEEAGHFSLLNKRLEELDSTYGELPAHDGLWQAAQETGHSLKARIAIVPLVLEARGLDVTPAMISKMKNAGDNESAAILSVVYEDEKHHVAFGAKWFRYICEREGERPEAAFHALVRLHFRGSLKPPFNDKARSEAGLTPGFYKPLVGVGRFD